MDDEPIDEPVWDPGPGVAVAASVGSRVLARTFDGVLFAGTFLVVTSVLGIDGGAGLAVAGTIGSLAFFAYYVYMDVNWGGTFGKRLTRIQVRSVEGLGLTRGQAIRRNSWMLIGLVPGVFGSILAIVVALWILQRVHASPSGQGPHDVYGNAVVITA